MTEGCSAPARRYVYTCPLSWGDLDAFGHVNNVRMLRYLEDARVAMLFVDAVKSGAKGMAHILVVRHEVDYLLPLEWRPEPVRVEMWVTAVRAAQFTLAYEVLDGEHTYVRASTVLVAYDFRRGSPRRLTVDERGFLETYLEP
ncbi:MAG: acyl-CoA thioesterase [Streptosporangiales bacterium]|nr:acyl-CoA thioesterase [Streptosporangiales bacterium]